MSQLHVFQFIVLTWEKTAVEQRVSVGVYCCAAAIHDGRSCRWSLVNDHADGHAIYDGHADS